MKIFRVLSGILLVILAVAEIYQGYRQMGIDVSVILGFLFLMTFGLFLIRDGFRRRSLRLP